MSEQTPSSANRVECPAEKDPAVRLFIGAAMCLGFGAWCAIDAYVRGKYPMPAEGNAKYLNKMLSHLFNHYAPFILLVVFIVLVVMALKVLRRSAVADEAGLTVDGKSYAWGDFAGLDASALPGKGRLVLKHTDGSSVVLNRYRYKNFKELVNLVERHVTADASASPAEGPESAAGEDG